MTMERYLQVHIILDYENRMCSKIGIYIYHCENSNFKSVSNRSAVWQDRVVFLKFVNASILMHFCFIGFLSCFLSFPDFRHITLFCKIEKDMLSLWQKITFDLLCMKKFVQLSSKFLFQFLFQSVRMCVSVCPSHCSFLSH